MKSTSKYTGFSIALAWPQTYCKQPGSWYDSLAGRLNISKNNYYKAGHAALILVDAIDQKSYYFDFGRYHAPFQYGRVRGKDTDHELEIKTKPKISSNGKILENFEELLNEIQLNPACHGNGELYASYSLINFNSAFNEAFQMQKAGPVPYGPFQYQGSNCSRFVNKIILAGKPKWNHKMQLRYFIPFTPTPLNNVNSLNYKLVVKASLNGGDFQPVANLNKKQLKTTLMKPERNAAIPSHSQWLSGEGAGSWFAFNFQNNSLIATRYSPEGVVECSGLYKNITSGSVSPDHEYTITYPSNCKVISLQNSVKEFQFERVPNQ